MHKLRHAELETGICCPHFHPGVRRRQFDLGAADAGGKKGSVAAADKADVRWTQPRILRVRSACVSRAVLHQAKRVQHVTPRLENLQLMNDGWDRAGAAKAHNVRCVPVEGEGGRVHKANGVQGADGVGFKDKSKRRQFQVEVLVMNNVVVVALIVA